MDRWIQGGILVLGICGGDGGFYDNVSAALFFVATAASLAVFWVTSTMLR
jgi:hypothetical protein